MAIPGDYFVRKNAISMRAYCHTLSVNGYLEICSRINLDTGKMSNFILEFQ